MLSKILLNTFFFSFVLLFFSSPGLADDLDPFGDNETIEDVEPPTDGRNNIQDEGKTFSGSIERLLDLAGEKKTATTKQWGTFEKNDPTSRENYDSLSEWRMKEEARKPLPSRPAYKSDISGLQKVLEEIRPTNKREEDYIFRYGYGPSAFGSAGAKKPSLR
jgi:hypothetical protein